MHQSCNQLLAIDAMLIETHPSRKTTPLILVALMATSLFINYVDRGNLATGAALIRADLHLSATAYGALAAGFYFAYAFCQLPAGALSDRFGGKLVLGIGALLWSASTFLTGFVESFLGLFVLRMMLGMGESVAFTTTSKIIASNVPREQMGFARRGDRVWLSGGACCGNADRRFPDGTVGLAGNIHSVWRSFAALACTMEPCTHQRDQARRGCEA